MNHQYTFTVPPAVADMESLTPDEVLSLTRSFLESGGVAQFKAELAMLAHVVSVVSFSGIDQATGQPCSGWVVGGRAPHLEISDAEVSTPIEALAIYCLYMADWSAAKGVLDAEGSVPAYRIPPDWSLLPYGPESKSWRLGHFLSFMEWNLVKKNAQHVLHPVIREKCTTRGWILKGEP